MPSKWPSSGFLIAWSDFPHHASRITFHVSPFTFPALFRQTQMPVIIPLLAPGGAGRVLTTVDAPFDVRALAQHVGLHERADVQAHPVVQVRVPAEGLLCASGLQRTKMS